MSAFAAAPASLFRLSFLQMQTECWHPSRAAHEPPGRRHGRCCQSVKERVRHIQCSPHRSGGRGVERCFRCCCGTVLPAIRHVVACAHRHCELALVFTVLFTVLHREPRAHTYPFHGPQLPSCHSHDVDSAAGNDGRQVNPSGPCSMA